MPTSIALMDDVVAGFVRNTKPSVVLDVGVGEGKIGRIVRKEAPVSFITGVEATADYWGRYGQHLGDVYNRICLRTFDSFIAGNAESYDLIVFGDVIEHMRWADAISALYDAAYHSRYFAAVWPKMCVQGPVDGNVFEQHRCLLSNSDIERFQVVDRIERSQDGYEKIAVLWKGYLP